MVTSDQAGRSPARTPWASLVQEFVLTGELPAALFTGLVRLVRRKARPRPAAIYSPTGLWDTDAYRTVATDVLVDQTTHGYIHKLSADRRLEDAFVVSHFCTAIDWHLSHIARTRIPERSVTYRELKRAITRSGHFREFEGIGWGLRTWAGTEFPRVQADFISERVVTALGTMPTKGKTTRKPNETRLREFAATLLEAAGYPLELGTLAEAAFGYFVIRDPGEAHWPTVRDSETGELEPLEVADQKSGHELTEMRWYVEDFIGKLGSADLYYLRELFLNGHRQSAVVRPGAGKSTISNCKRRLDESLRRLGAAVGIELCERRRFELEDLIHEAILKRTYELGNEEDELPPTAGSASERDPYQGGEDEATPAR